MRHADGFICSFGACVVMSFARYAGLVFFHAFPPAYGGGYTFSRRLRRLVGARWTSLRVAGRGARLLHPSKPKTGARCAPTRPKAGRVGDPGGGDSRGRPVWVGCGARSALVESAHGGKPCRRCSPI